MNGAFAFAGLVTATAALIGAAPPAAADFGPLRPNEASPPAYAVPFSEVRRLRSAINGISYNIYVRLPRSYGTGERRYPLIITLDADLAFSIAANVSDKLAARGQLPELIVASIAYPDVYPDEHLYRLNRTRDYTPVFSPSGGYGPEYQRASGGGPKFAAAIANEIIPALERQYRTVPAHRTLVGHSYGGLFGAYVLGSRPDLFANYLLISPSLWYADRRTLRETSLARGVRLTQKTRVYLAVGALEGSNGGESMAGDLAAFARALRDRMDPNLTVEDRVFEDETHDSVFPAALSTGLRHLFRDGPD